MSKNKDVCWKTSEMLLQGSRKETMTAWGTVTVEIGSRVNLGLQRDTLSWGTPGGNAHMAGKAEGVGKAGRAVGVGAT